MTGPPMMAMRTQGGTRNMPKKEAMKKTIGTKRIGIEMSGTIPTTRRSTMAEAEVVMMVVMTLILRAAVLVKGTRSRMGTSGPMQFFSLKC